MVSADLSQEELDKQEMTVQFYIEDENGSVEDGCPTTKSVSDITANIGSLSGYGNIKSPVSCMRKFPVLYICTVRNIQVRYGHPSI